MMTTELEELTITARGLSDEEEEGESVELDADELDDDEDDDDNATDDDDAGSTPSEE